MSISIKLDAEQFIPARNGFAQTVTARDIWNKGSKTNVILDNYTGVLMCKPIQFNNDWETAGTVTRYPISSWTGDTSHWEDLLTSGGLGNGLLNAHATAGKITTSTTFDANTSFLVSFYLCGSSNDKAAGIDLEFGQWKLSLSTFGDATLTRSGVVRFTDIITDPIADEFVELLIMPYVNNSLLVRRINSNNSGMLVSLTADQDTTEMGTDPPVIISSAKFSVTPQSVLCKQFSLTELTYDTTADYELISPVLNCIWPPSATQTMTTSDDGLTNYGGGVAVALWEETTDTSFAADGIKTKLRIAFLLTPLAHKTPMTRGLTFGFEAEDRIALLTPADISADVRSYEIHADAQANQTEAIIEIRNPDSYDLQGACSRLCTIDMDGINIFRGILAEPPVYKYTENGDRFYSIRVQSFYRYLQTASIVNDLNLAGMTHSEAVAWLCYLAGLAPNDVVFGTTTDVLPTEYTTDGQLSNNWTIKPFDSAETWTKKICDETGWRLTDGISSGVYVLMYLDPLLYTTVPAWNFHTKSAFTTADNQKIYSWEEYSIEPECNEFHLIFCNEAGEKCDAVYYDADSANGSLAIGDRPSNWLGFVKRGGFDVGNRTEAQGQALSLRIGAEVAKRVDMARFTAEYQPALWVNDVVTVHDDSAGTSANYRINTIAIKGIHEVSGSEIRVCDILAEKL